MSTPKSDAALQHFDRFTARVRARLEAGRSNYGDSSFEKPLHDVVEEIRQEIEDQMGWSFLLWCRVNEIGQKILLSVPDSTGL